MSRHRYYDVAGQPISRAEGIELLEDAAKRRVAHTALDDVEVSTVALVIDHAFEGPPLIFETMIFGGDSDGDTWRYSTLDEALEGHQRVVVALSSESRS